jgi:hypothetical protein
METRIREMYASFTTLLLVLLEAQDKELLGEEGRLRPEGKINLYDLGDVVWKEQFR